MNAPSTNAPGVVEQQQAAAMRRPRLLRPPLPRIRPHVPAPDKERRSRNPINALTRDLDRLCTHAVDHWEVAAGLEARGWTDERVRAAFGHPDVFSLAAEMFARVPRRPQRAVAADNPWKETPGRHLLRGATFSLPGVLYATAGTASPSGAGVGDVLLLAASLTVGWGGSQALGYSGQLGMGWGHRPQTLSMMRRWVLLSAVLSVVTGALLMALPGFSRPAVLLAAAVPLYMVAAGALLVLAQDLLLTGVLAATVVAAVSADRLGAPEAASALAAAGVLVVCGAVFVLTRGVGLRTPMPRIDGQRAATWLQGGWGVCSAVTVLAATAAVRDAAVVPALLALAVWMGPAEWVVHRTRRTGWNMLHEEQEPARFRARITRGLAVWTGLWLTSYLVVAGTAVTLTAGPRPGALVTVLVPALVGLGLVAGLITAALGGTLQALWTSVAALAVAAVTAVALVALAAAGLPTPPTIVPALVLLAGFAGAHCTLALRTVGRPAGHL